MEQIEMGRNQNGKEKQRSHAYLNRKYNQAIKDGFYFEALMIVYNLVEDRLIALLHYAGVVSRDAEKLYVTKRTRASIRKLLDKKEKSIIDVKNISVKIDILHAFCVAKSGEDDYVNAVKKQIDQSITADALCNLLGRCTKWKDIRNKFVHGLANKNPYDVEAYALEVAVEGHKIARDIDNLVGRFSKNNRIRKDFKIQ